MQKTVSSARYVLMLVVALTSFVAVKSYVLACEMQPCEELPPPPMSSSQSSSTDASINPIDSTPSLTDPSAAASTLTEALTTLGIDAPASTLMCPVSCVQDSSACATQAEIAPDNIRISFPGNVPNPNGGKIPNIVLETFQRKTNPQSPLGFDLIKNHTVVVPVKIDWMLPLCTEAKIEASFYLSTYDKDEVTKKNVIDKTALLGSKIYDVKDNGTAFVVASHKKISDDPQDMDAQTLRPKTEYAFMVTVRQKKYNPQTNAWDLYFPYLFSKAIYISQTVDANNKPTESLIRDALEFKSSDLKIGQ